MAAGTNPNFHENDELLRNRQVMWRGFTKFMTWSSIAVVVILVGMALFLLD